MASNNEIGIKLTADAAQLQTEAKQASSAIDGIGKSVKRSVVDANRNFGQLSHSLKGIPRSFGQLKNSSNSAALALTDINRIAQDVPFGFIGIQNNLNPMLESFRRLKAETGSTGGALKALASSLGGVGGLGLAISLVSSAFLIFQNGISGFNRKTREATDKAEQFADALKRVSDVVAESSGSVSGQLDTVRTLAEAITDTNRAYNERNNALQRLRSINKEYFGDLSLEASSLATLTSRVNDYTNALVAQAVAKGFTDEISRVTQEINKQTLVYDELKKAAHEAQLQQDKFAGQKTVVVDPKATNGVTVLNTRYLQLLNNTEEANEALAKQGGILDKLHGNYAQLREGLRTSTDELLKFKAIEGTGVGNKGTDEIKQRIAALKELIAAGVEVKQNTLELQGLEIKLIRRDGKKEGFTQAEIEELVFKKLFPEQHLTLSKPLVVTVPVESIVKVAIDKGDPAGDNIEQGIQRTYDRLVKAGQEAGKKLQTELAKPLEQVNQSVQRALGNVFEGIGEGIADVLTGGNPMLAFIGIIGDTLQQLGKALIAYGLAADAVKKAIAGIFSGPQGPFIAIAAGVAAIAAGKLLKSQLAKTPKFAQGALVTGPTLATVGDAGPELIVPFNRVNSFMDGDGGGEVIVRMHGSELYGVLQRWNNSRNRR